MQRYFVNEFSNNRFYISGEDRHHIVNVMRLRQGDHVICSMDGKSALCSIEEIGDDRVIAFVVKWEEGTAELPVRVAIASGLPKGDKLEWIIQKGTELGAAKFIPFAAARSVVKWDQKKAKKKVERWQRIAKEAAEQSHRSLLPEITETIDLKELINLSAGFDHRLVAYEEDAKGGEASVLSQSLRNIKPGQSLLFVFGPEGGLTEGEIKLLKSHHFETCGLGPRILRTETAPLYALAAVSYQTELLR